MANGLFQQKSKRRRQAFRAKDRGGRVFTFNASIKERKRAWTPNIITMFWRYLFLMLFQIAWMVFSALIIMGEDVFWRFAFVDQWYTNYGSNPEDAWQFIYLTGYMVIWAIGAFWAVGMFDWYK